MDEEMQNEEVEFSGENPGELSIEKKKELEEKQKEFEYEETHLAGESLKIEARKETLNTFFRWVIALFVAMGLGFLYWYLLL